jgi:uncharacterized coiled-coil protein SlyX
MIDAISLTAMVANKKALATWLVLLTTAVGIIGDKVYVERTRELTTVEMKLEAIQNTVNRMDATVERNAQKLDALLAETLRVQADLAAHEKATSPRR